MTDAWHARLTLPAYQAREAAHLAGISPQTVSGWFYGYPKSPGARSRPVFPKGKRRRVSLSYLQLVEVAFVATCRKNGMSLRRIKDTRAYLAAAFGVDYPFADLRLASTGPSVLKEMENSDQLLVASAHGQIAWRAFMSQRIAEFDYEGDLAARWFPRGRNVPIFVDPRINFGRPMLAKSGMATWVIADALRAAESEDDVMLDYGIGRDEIGYVLEFEPRRAA